MGERGPIGSVFSERGQRRQRRSGGAKPADWAEVAGPLPGPPAWMTLEERRVYRATARQLLAAGVKLCALDHAALECYAHYVVLGAECQRQIAAEGVTLTSGRGRVYVHPLIRVRAAAARQVVAFGGLLLTTAAARQRLGIRPVEVESENVLDRLLRSRIEQ